MPERLKRLFHFHRYDKSQSADEKSPHSISTTTAIVPSKEASAPTIAPEEDLLKDCWHDAFKNLSPESQAALLDMGFDKVPTVSMKDSIEGLVDVVNKKQKECEEKFWSISIGGKDFVLRKYTASLLGWLEKAGDIAIQFAPPQASLPWDLIKNVMQIPVNESEQMGALLAITERVVRITSRGQVYEQVYLPKTSDIELDPVQVCLERSIIKIYTTSLELLVESKSLLSASTARRTLEAIVNPDKITGSLASIDDEEKELLKDVNACETNRKVAKDNQMIKMLEALNAPMARIDKGVRRLLDNVNDNERIQILEWVSVIPYGAHHDQIRDTRAPGTGEWLLENAEFQKWDSDESSGVFWLHGSVGTGKTYLSSRIIDYLQGQMSNPLKHEGFVFFYCQRDDDTRSERLPILQSIVRQLATSTSDSSYIPKRLSELYRLGRERGGNLRLAQCEEQILTSINMYQQTTILIDALDECKADHRTKLLQSLASLLSQAQKPVKIFISSRPDIGIQSQLQLSSQVAISANDNEGDIQRFLNIQLDQASLNKALKPLKGDIINRLMERCQGMFQWAFLQVRQIARCNTPAAVRHHLSNLPPDLEKAYDNIWNAIDEFEKPQVIRAILWTMVAVGPMDSQTLLTAIRVSPNGDVGPLNELPNEEGLLNMCRNLLEIDSYGDWQFPHLSVKEYLERNQGFSLPKAHQFAAQVCLSYMVDKYKNPDPWFDLPNGESTGNNNFDMYDLNKFHIYIRHCWFVHVRRGQPTENSDLISTLKTFLGSPQKASLQYEAWYLAARRDSDYGYLITTPYYKREDVGLQCGDIIFRQLTPTTNPVFAVCRFSLGSFLMEWWNDNKVDIFCKNPQAAEFAATLRPSWRFDPSADSALDLAASQGHLEIVKYLVEAGAEVNIQLKNRISTHTHCPLQSAIESDNAELVRYLIQDAKANIDIPANNGGHLITVAAARPGLDIIKLLLTAGADINTRLLGERGDSVLALKVQAKELESVRYLIEEAGADVNMKLDSVYGSALEAASQDVMNILKYLVQETNVDVNSLSSGGRYGNALTAAAADLSSWNIDAVRFLLQAGANINVPTLTGSYGSALTAAALHGVENVEYLLAEGADPNLTLRCGEYGSPLVAAYEKYNLDSWELLLQAGADINKQLEVGIYGSVLAAFAARNHDARSPFRRVAKWKDCQQKFYSDNEECDEDWFECMIKFGLDVNMPLDHGKFGSALAVAVNAGSSKKVRYMLNAEVDVNMTLKGRDFGCALAIAAAKNPTMLDTLIEAQADVNIQHPAAKYPTPLVAAAFFGRKIAVEKLIEAGADVNLKLEHSRFGTALEAAQASFIEADMSWLLTFCDDDEDLTSLAKEYAEIQKLEIVELLQGKATIT
ncbi:hypothetical protein N7528_008453 [Penicillium herquei]|nr:hypothetical protein N7528_008453 [Penicillium herquei]